VPEAVLARTPEVAIYGDGRVIVSDTGLRSPRPALPRLLERHVSLARLPGLVADALAAGVGGSPDLGRFNQPADDLRPLLPDESACSDLVG
jgi:hypothetical protein